MPLPNISGVQQAGVNPLSVQKQGDNSQAFANALREINVRLDNIMNVRGNVQAGIYGAFGNNVLSRSMSGITDAIGDAIGSLFGGDEEAADDPITKTLKEHTTILKEIAEKSGVDNGKSEKIVDEIVLLRHDIKHNQELQHRDTLDQDKILEQILDSLTGIGKSGDTGDDVDDTKFDKIVDSLKNISDRSERTDDVIDVVATEAVDSEKLDKKVDTPAETIDKQDSDRNLDSKQTPSSLLKKILDALTSANKTLDKLVKAQPMSTREAELESMRVKRDQLDKRTETEDIKTVEEGGKRGFDWSRIFSGLLDFDANLRGFKNIFGGIIKAMQTGITALMGAISPVVGLIVKLGSAIATVITSIAGKAAGAVSTITKTGLAIAKKAMPFAIPAAIMGAAGAGLDSAAGLVGAGGEEIDTAQDDKNWAQMGILEKTESGLARGVEKVADFLSLDNFSNEAKAQRIKNETEYLRKKSAGDDLAQIEMTQRDLRKIEQQQATKSSGGASPVIQDNRVTQNQTIMPTRTVVENPEQAYRRYLNNILQPAR